MMVALLLVVVTAPCLLLALAMLSISARAEQQAHSHLADLQELKRRREAEQKAAGLHRAA